MRKNYKNGVKENVLGRIYCTFIFKVQCKDDESESEQETEDGKNVDPVALRASGFSLSLVCGLPGPLPARSPSDVTDWPPSASSLTLSSFTRREVQASFRTEESQNKLL